MRNIKKLGVFLLCLLMIGVQLSMAEANEQTSKKTLANNGTIYDYYDKLGIPMDRYVSKEEFDQKYTWPKCEYGHSMNICVNCYEMYCPNCGELCSCKFKWESQKEIYGDKWCKFCNEPHSEWCDYCQKWYCSEKEIHRHSGSSTPTVSQDNLDSWMEPDNNLGLGDYNVGETVSCGHPAESAMGMIGYSDDKNNSTHTATWTCGACGTSVTAKYPHELDSKGNCMKCLYEKSVTTTPTIMTGTVTNPLMPTTPAIREEIETQPITQTTPKVEETPEVVEKPSVTTEKCYNHSEGNVKEGSISKEQYNDKEHITTWYCLKCNKYASENVLHKLVNGKCECGYTTKVEITEKCYNHSEGNIKEGSISKEKYNDKEHITTWYCLKCNKWASENILHKLVAGKCECGYTTKVEITEKCYNHSEGNVKEGSITKEQYNDKEHITTWYCLKCNKYASENILHKLVNGKCECGYTVKIVQDSTSTNKEKLFNDYDGTTHSWAYDYVYNMKKLGFLKGNPNANGGYDLLADEELVTLHVFSLMSRVLQNNDVFPEPTNTTIVYGLEQIKQHASWAESDYIYIMRLYGEKYGDGTGAKMVAEIFPNNPNDWFAKSLTREEAAALIGRIFGESRVEHTEFPDWYNVDSDLRSSVAKAIEMGIIQGDKDASGVIKVNPSGKLTRIQGITMMYNLYNKLCNNGVEDMYITQI